MSSAGQAVGGVVGAVAGFFVGGPSGALYGAQLGMMAGGLIDPPKGPEIVGPRLDDLKVQTSTYGAPIPRLYGTIATAGNIFWLENNSLKEVAKKKKSGGKGGPSTTTTTFSYYATFALGLCDCSDGSPIAGVRRIWCGADLIYDAGSSDLGTILASNKTAELFALHNGAIDQAPNSRMQAALGVADTPAYRGLAYIVFNDFPLEKYGNSLMAAQLKVEVVTSGTVNKLSLITENISPSTPLPGWSYTFGTVHLSPELVRFYMPAWDNNYPPSSTYRTYDLRVNVSSISPAINIATPNYPVPPNFDTDNPDTFWIDASRFGPGFSSAGNIVERKSFIFGCDKTSIRLIKNESLLIKNSVSFDSRVGTTDGNYCYTIKATGGTIEKYDENLNLVASLAGNSVSVVMGSTRIDAYGGYLWIFEHPPINGCRVFKADLNLNSFQYIGTLPNIYASGTNNNVYVRVIDGVIIRAWPDNTAKTHHVQFIQIDNLAIASTPLANIIKAECLLSNLLAISDIDTSLLVQTVRGYRVSSVAAIRGAIDPLQAAWPFDVIQSGYNIVFKPRGSSSVVIIPSDDLDARGSGDQFGIGITNAREMDSVLPRRLVCNYLDADREYDTGSQVDERLNTDAANTKIIEMSIVLTASECLGIVQTLLYMYWMERYAISFTLPSKYNQIEAGDVVTITADESIYSLRLTSITYTQENRLECSARYANAAIYVHAAQAETGQSSGQVLTISGPSATVLLDIPLLLDTLDGPGFVSAMSGYMSGWPGGQLLRSDDQGQSWDSLQGFTKPGATIGSANNAIGHSQVGMIDKSSALLVGLIRGDLSSVTELAMLNGANYFAYGKHGRWEIIAAQNCTLQSDGSYLLTDLLRGQQGTEWASGLHAVGDDVILLDSELAFVSVNLNSIGQSRLYRGVTNGALVESASDKEFTYSGVNLECLSPCYLNGNRNAANDWSLTWIRRTRVGGALRDYVDASLGEASEAYEVEIYSSNTYATLKRTITGLTTPAAAYTSAQQVTDFGSNQSTLYIKIYQLSANVGRGYPLITSITR